MVLRLNYKIHAPATAAAIRPTSETFKAGALLLETVVVLLLVVDDDSCVAAGVGVVVAAGVAVTGVAAALVVVAAPEVGWVLSTEAGVPVQASDCEL